MAVAATAPTMPPNAPPSACRAVRASEMTWNDSTTRSCGEAACRSANGLEPSLLIIPIRACIGSDVSPLEVSRGSTISYPGSSSVPPTTDATSGWPGAMITVRQGTPATASSRSTTNFAVRVSIGRQNVMATPRWTQTSENPRRAAPPLQHRVPARAGRGRRRTVLLDGQRGRRRLERPTRTAHRRGIAPVIRSRCSPVTDRAPWNALGTKAPERGPAMWCPNCGFDFTPGIKRCPDCGADLVATAPDWLVERERSR